MRLLYVLLLSLAAGSAGASPVYYLATDQTGAQTQIDVNHTSAWTFTPNTEFSLGGALLVMKDGQTASSDVTLSAYIGVDGTGVLMASVTQSHAQFCAGVSNCGNYQTHSFLFTNPVALTVGVTYHLRLTSTAPDTQSDAYFIKNNTYFISNINAIAIVPSPIGPGIPVPESNVSFLLGSGLLAIAIGLYRRR